MEDFKLRASMLLTLTVFLELLSCRSALAGNLTRGEKCDIKNSSISCDSSVGLECSQGLCDCKSGYTISRNGSKCLEIARNGLESPCEESIQCWKSLLGRLSECNIGTYKCSCYESDTLPIVFHQGRCYYGESLGEYCQIEGLCSATTQHAVCKMGVCQCQEGYVPSWDKSRCLPIATQGLNSPCEENIQCEKSALGTLSECNLERMQCECYQIPMVPMVFHMGRCYFGAGLGDVCQVDPQCSSKTEHSTCGPDGKCRCSLGYAMDQNQTECVLQSHLSFNLELDLFNSPSANSGIESEKQSREREMDIAPEIEPECLENSICVKMYGHFSRCNFTTGACECFNPDKEEQVLDFKPVGHNKSHSANQRVKCYSTKYLGQGCKFHGQCAVATSYAKCVNGVCECQQDTHVPSEDRRQCLQVAQGLDSPCSEDPQCIKSPAGELSICDEDKGRCVCSTATTAHEGRCYARKFLGAHCGLDIECQTDDSSLALCVNGKCTCASNSIPTRDNSTCILRPAKTQTVLYKSSVGSSRTPCFAAILLLFMVPWMWGRKTGT